ncbi:hypothetical protein F5B17DRAFT_240543 [Nemania serpens]|nr:hypothetical protein F5B17DRAFT_240543 [Nemania serpens]
MGGRKYGARLKASTKKTPQPSPAYHSAVERVQGIGTPDRLSQLRGACLVHDRHRCVVTRYFDHKEADRRMVQNSDDARDNNGTLLLENTVINELEVAYILPHSLMKADVGYKTPLSKRHLVFLICLTAVLYT